MPVTWNEIHDAFEFISSDPMFGNSAFINRETGEIHWRSDWGGAFEPLPEDIDDDAKYVELPNPRDLDLGRPLVMRFAADELDEHYDEIDAIFSRKGAFVLVHLDRPSPELLRYRTEEFDPDAFFCSDCPLCQMIKEGGVLIFDDSVFEDETMPD